MARSSKQIAVTARVIMISALAKEFRKSEIIKKIIAIARDKNMISTGDLINPKKSGSITPDSDDRWFEKPESLKVFVGPIVNGIPSFLRVFVAPEYGVDFKYYYLTQKSPKKKWFPNVRAIESWVRRKRIGELTESKKIAWAISKSIEKKGIRKTNLANPFLYKRTGVKPTIERGVNKGMIRVSELYQPMIADYIDNTFSNIF
jgi:hypothetical protein|tara:strand:+ start:2092 stop:2700 length:609 start_codon:yes stop_codon:yes gene_type:complete